MTYESPRQIETAFDFQMRARLDDLGEHLSENQLLSKILAADDDAISIAGATEEGQKENEDQQATDDLLAEDLLRNAWQAASLLSSQTQRTQPPLQRPQSYVGRQSQNGGRNCSSEDYLVIHHGESTKNKFSQSAGPDGCGDCRHAD